MTFYLFFKNAENVPVFRNQIRRIRMFLGLPDQQPDPLVRGTDPEDQDPDTDPVHWNLNPKPDTYVTFDTLLWI